MIVLASRVQQDVSGAPGEPVTLPGGGTAIAAGSGAVEPLMVQIAGKRPMGFAEFLRGRRLEPGGRFGSVEAG
jgi:methionyl-tRNA formyltransferase